MKIGKYSSRIIGGGGRVKAFVVPEARWPSSVPELCRGTGVHVVY